MLESRLDRPRLLCVDDEANVLAALHRLLRRRFDVVLACGAQAALERLRSDGPFAVVITDLQMPGQDGLSFLALARTIAPTTVAILMTGGGNVDVPPGAAFRCLPKPFSPEALCTVLDGAVEQYLATGDPA